jgi:hypothetical protein
MYNRGNMGKDLDGMEFLLGEISPTFSLEDL